MMYDYMIDEIVEALIKTHAIRNESELKKRARKALENYTEDKIFTVWCAEDIISCARENGKKLSKEKAIEILDEVEHDFDASIGINWDVIREHI